MFRWREISRRETQAIFIYIPPLRSLTLCRSLFFFPFPCFFLSSFLFIHISLSVPFFLPPPFPLSLLYLSLSIHTHTFSQAFVNALVCMTACQPNCELALTYMFIAGYEQREAMATVGVLQLRPDLMGLTLEIMTVLGTESAAALGAGGAAGGAA